jgi:hypothetical protein
VSEEVVVASTIEREEEQVRELFGSVDEIIDVAHSIQDDHPDEAARLMKASREALATAVSVRVPIAAKLLLVSDKTVRAWVTEGLLTPRGGSRRVVLDAGRLHEVLQLIRELRAHGQDRDLRATLWRRLADEALLDRDDLAESLAEMRAGSVAPALTLDEEQSRRG